MLGRKKVKGEVTAFLSLVFLLLLSFIGGVMESASIQVSKNYKKTEMDLAMESVFAEYQRELLENYDIFALEGTYETGSFSQQEIKKRLEYYGGAGMEQDFVRIQFLTDNGGQPFYEQIIRYMEEKTGTEKLQELLGNTEKWKTQEQEFGDRMDQVGKAESESPELPKEELLAKITNLKTSSLLEQIVPKTMILSTKQVEISQQVSQRKLQTGKGEFTNHKEENQGVSKMLLGEYMVGHFGNAVQPKEKSRLSYEQEYLIGGKESDQENLEEVAKKLRLMRFASDYTYLMTDTVKQGEAEAMALTMTTVIALPELAEIVKQAILLGWAYGESIVDLRALLKGNKVPLMKTTESWQLSLAGLFTLGTGEGETEGVDTPGGLLYQDYLRMLLFLESKGALTMKALDLVEQNLQTTYNKAFFRADHCISKLETRSTCKLRRGISFTFQTMNAYQ
ncbi:MAG: DUF5702 domain-containing protein [Lachnospiraceae bacterium]